MKTAREYTKDVKPADVGRYRGHSKELPERVTLDQLDTSHHAIVAAAADAARAWAERKVSGVENASLVLVATGIELPDGGIDPDRTGFGTGKTHIAMAIAWSSYYCDDEGRPISPSGQFYTAKEILDRLGDGETMTDIAPPPPQPGDYWARDLNSRGTQVLVVDDIGSEGVLRFVGQHQQQSERQARYFEIFNHCYNKGISVVVTANMSLDDLAEWIGGRAWSRLQGMAPPGFMIDMTGVPDWRRKIGGR